MQALVLLLGRESSTMTKRILGILTKRCLCMERLKNQIRLKMVAPSISLKTIKRTANRYRPRDLTFPILLQKIKAINWEEANKRKMTVDWEQMTWIKYICSINRPALSSNWSPRLLKRTLLTTSASKLNLMGCFTLHGNRAKVRLRCKKLSRVRRQRLKGIMCSFKSADSRSQLNRCRLGLRIKSNS